MPQLYVNDTIVRFHARVQNYGTVNTLCYRISNNQIRNFVLI